MEGWRGWGGGVARALIMRFGDEDPWNLSYAP
jgi:hypothetical protein